MNIQFWEPINKFNYTLINKDVSTSVEDRTDTLGKSVIYFEYITKNNVFRKKNSCKLHQLISSDVHIEHG